MAEYIDREALVDVLAVSHAHHANNSREASLLDRDIRLIWEQPTADVVPVVHGRWEHLEQGWIDLWRCSACGDEWTFEYDPTDSETKVNYCPNCGARMDGE